MTRIAYIVENYGQISETFVSDLIDGLAQSGIVGRVFTDRVVDKNKKISSGFDICETGFCTQLNRSVRWSNTLTRLFTNHSIITYLRKKVAKQALLKKISEFNSDVAYVDHGNNAVLVRETLNNLKLPFVVHFHGRDATALLGNNEYRFEILKVFQDASRVIVPSDYLRKRLIISGCSDEKIIVIPYGVDLEKIVIPNWENRSKLLATAIFVGRLVEKKNPIALLYAFKLVVKRLPQSKLTIIGDGPLKSEVAMRIQSLGLVNNVKMLGALPHSQVLEQLGKHRIYVQHSVTASNGDQEGFPVSLIEAAACGLPIVSTVHSGIPESVVHAETGYLVQEYDYEAMANYMINLLSDTNLAITMGKSGRKRIEENFQLSKRLTSITKLINELSVIT